MTQKIQLNATVCESQCGQRLDQALAELFPTYSRSRIKEWILAHNVTVNGTTKRIPKEKIFGGERIEIQADIESNERWMPQKMPLNIIYEDADILVMNKPAGLVVHPGAGNPDHTLLNALLDYYPDIAQVPRAGIVHRLDKDTTGLMVIAKTLPAQTGLVAALQARLVTREYEAIAVGHMISGGSIDQPVARHTSKRTHMAVHASGKPAVTHYRIVQHFRAHTRLRLRLETGRTHQIRVHLSYIHHPLVGDPLYGQRLRHPKGALEELIETLRAFDRQALHASMLRLRHPVTQIEMEWYADLPQDMLDLISSLKTDQEAFDQREV